MTWYKNVPSAEIFLMFRPPYTQDTIIELKQCCQFNEDRKCYIHVLRAATE